VGAAGKNATTKEGCMSPKVSTPHGRRAAVLLALALVGGVAGGARAGDCDCKCPPPYCHPVEGPPCIKFKCECPRPVCPPFDCEFWGYYPTCWRCWPFGFKACGTPEHPLGHDGPVPPLPGAMGEAPLNPVPAAPVLASPWSGTPTPTPVPIHPSFDPNDPTNPDLRVPGQEDAPKPKPVGPDTTSDAPAYGRPVIAASYVVPAAPPPVRPGGRPRIWVEQQAVADPGR
jgi:hypothetical protein